MFNALSFDLEDYFQVRSFSNRIPYASWDSYLPRFVGNTRRLLALLERRGVKGTFFVLGWNAEREKGLVLDIKQSGHEVASHGWSHRPIYQMTRDEFRAEVSRTKELLEDIIGSPVLGYRAPSYSITSRTLWALTVLAETGHAYDSSIYPIRRQAYGIPSEQRVPHTKSTASGRIVEFPMSTARIAGWNLPFASGAYFRMSPLWLTTFLIRRANRFGVPAILNLHPWELDPSQPRVSSVLSHPNHYLFLGRTESRLDNLLAMFCFAPVQEVLRDLRLLPQLAD